MEYKAKNIEVLRGLGGCKLIVDIDGSVNDTDMERLANAAKPWRLNLKEWRERRSLDSNAYCWTLIHKLAEATGISAADIYRQAIREIGGVSQTVCVLESGVAALIRQWCGNGLGWQADTMPSKLDGCVNVILYAGSSTFDTAQMSRLIDSVVQDCRAVGIETKTPEQLADMLSLWGEKDEQEHHFG